MLYYKIIDGKQVFSECKSIKIEGGWISNPTPEQIAAAGWIEYVPPVVPPIPETEPSYDAILQAVKTMLKDNVEQLSDEDALSVAALFPTWIEKIGEVLNVGERLWYDGKLFKVILSHTAQEDWTPEVSPSLFVEVSIAEWPEWVQPGGAHSAYMIGDKVTHNGLHYISDIDNNVWEPGVYGWSVASE